jgi:phosphopantothenoylcysteine decarboxylase / phosphopantothenate---cysteine ligase
MLQGKTIVVGVTGGIAVYKAVDLVSRLRKLGADIHVIMTKSATQFVQPLTFREISGNPVVTDMWDEPKMWHVQHISLARKADLLAIVPATANIMGKIAHGIADDMLTTTVLATTAPVFLAPAMNTQMYKNPITQDNMHRLRSYGFRIMEPASGYLACGEEGMGRLPEPADIVDRIVAIMMAKRDFSGKTMLVTAAGTQEPIDPVRYIGNRSSGKMGYAIAQAARDRGARVILISGPTFLPQPHGIEFIAVQTAQEMKEAVLRYYGEVQVVIKAAAVADYRPQQAAEHKIKKLNSHMTIELEKNPDILWELGQKKQHQILVGFAAETQSLLENAREKLERKNLDMLVANDVTIAGAGFNTETNIVKLLLSDGAIEELPLLTKKEVAEIILDKIDVFLQRKC